MPDGEIPRLPTTLDTAVQLWVDAAARRLKLSLTDSQVEQVAQRALDDAHAAIVYELTVFARTARPWTNPARET